MALNPEWRGPGSLNIILAGESPAGLFRIYSSTAKFMIRVMNPWQFALCLSQLYSFVTPRVLSALPCSFACFRAKAELCRKGSFLHGKKKKKIFKPTTQKTWEGKFPKGSDFAEQRLGETPLWCREGSYLKTFVVVAFSQCPEGSSEGVGLCVVMLRYLLASLLEPALFQGGHGAAVTFYLKTLQVTVGMRLMLLNCTLQKGWNGKFDSVCVYAPLLNTSRKNFRDSGNALWSHIGCAGRPPALPPRCPAGSQELSCGVAACPGGGQPRCPAGAGSLVLDAGPARALPSTDPCPEPLERHR